MITLLNNVESGQAVLSERGISYLREDDYLILTADDQVFHYYPSTRAWKIRGQNKVYAVDNIEEMLGQYFQHCRNTEVARLQARELFQQRGLEFTEAKYYLEAEGYRYYFNTGQWAARGSTLPPGTDPILLRDAAIVAFNQYQIEFEHHDDCLQTQTKTPWGKDATYKFFYLSNCWSPKQGKLYYSEGPADFIRRFLLG